jgi:hypothetical protein
MEGRTMGQVRHGSATTTHAVRAAIQRSQASTAALSRKLGINPKTVAKWRNRETVEDRKTGPKEPHSSVLSEEEEAMVVAFLQYTLLPIDDCLYALQPTITHLTRSVLHLCLQRNGISRLPEVGGDKPKRQPFRRYPIGFFHMETAEVQTAGGKLYLFVAIDRTRKLAVTHLVEKADPPGVVFLCAPDRGGQNAERFLRGFDGIQQFDGYTGYNRLTCSSRKGGDPIRVAHCWAHARRKLKEAFDRDGSEIEAEGLRRIA